MGGEVTVKIYRKTPNRYFKIFPSHVPGPPYRNCTNLQDEAKIFRYMTPTKAIMIKNVMALVFKTPQHQRRQFLSQLHGVVELSQVRGLGYKVSKRTWNNAMHHAKTKGVGAEVDPPKRPPSKSLAPETAKSIVDFVTKHSKHCPNRFVTVKKKQVAVMEMEGLSTPLLIDLESVRTLWRMFSQETNITVAESTFRNYIPKWFKKPKRKTDMCGICADLPMLERRLDHETDPDARRDLELDIQRSYHHRNKKDARREDFYNDKKKLKTGEAVIVMDFKENLRLNRAPEELGRDFYNAPQRGVFGIVVWFRRGEDLVKQELDIVSECLNKDSQFVRESLDILRNKMDFWQQLNIHSVNVWTDNCGSHFKTKEMMSYFAKWKNAGLRKVFCLFPILNSHSVVASQLF
jgi:hypothetical protein